jgi:hypothetical protein
MPRDESFLLRTTIETHLIGLGRSLRVFAATLPATADNFALLLRMLDPVFLEALVQIDTDEALTLVGKQRAALQLGKAAAVSVERFRKEHVGGLETRIGQEKREIADALRKALASSLSASPPAPRVDAMARQLDGLDPLQITALYASASPEQQILIEAVADLTGGKILLRQQNAAPRWIEMLPQEARARAAAERSQRAAPEATERLAELEQIRNVYDMVLRTADKLIETELAKRGAMPRDESADAFIDPATGEKLLPART